MAKSHCGVVCTWPLPADLPFNVLWRRIDGRKTLAAGCMSSLSYS